MIRLSTDFDLGRDKTRIKDPADARRQTATATTLLERLFNRDAAKRYELQLLADEVGMGKTFVALATAYSILAHLRRFDPPDDLVDCVQRVVIVTPQNPALFRKWQREVSEFVERCVVRERREEARQWFAPETVERQDELIAALRKPGKGPRVVVTYTGAFGSARLHSLDLKRRHVFGVLFRYWGNRFPMDRRERLLRGAPSWWPRNPYQLVDFDDRERDQLRFDEEEILTGIERLDRDRGEESRVEALFRRCRDISEPYVRDREELFQRVERDVVEIYRGAISQLGTRGVPLVIVDEAHNWKNGPSAGTNGYYRFVETLGRRARRALLLTATPFQLRPNEMLELLRVSDDLEFGANRSRSEARRIILREFRESRISPVLERASESSRAFARAWGRLSSRLGTADVEAAWSDRHVALVRAQLRDLTHAPGAVDLQVAASIIEDAVSKLDPDLRSFFREGLRLFLHNTDLSAKLGRVMIRHRRATDHRLVRVGAEFGKPAGAVSIRPDRHVLHAAEGLDVRGEAELPHYVLMRCVSEMKKGRGRSSLGSDLTGCYSTLLESAEGRAIKKSLADSVSGQRYLSLLLELVDTTRDAGHPKVAIVVEEVLRAWRCGEKTLVFCFRTHTAERLRTIVDERIRRELEHRRQRCLGGEEQLRSFRARLTGRDRDLVGLALDRVLWSFLWAASSHNLERRGEWSPCPYNPGDLVLQDAELRELARLLLSFRIDFAAERVDRVFLHRVHEHLVARRLLRIVGLERHWRALLERIADEQWIVGPYGLTPRHEHEEGGEDRASFDERGAQTIYASEGVASTPAIEQLGRQLAGRRGRARERSILDAYASGPSLWLGREPAAISSGPGDCAVARTIADLHGHLAAITVRDGAEDWEGRLVLFQALRRSLLRESVLLRLLPDRSEREEAQWGELLAETFYAALPGQAESMADRIAVFLEDVRAASGSLLDGASARGTLLEATRLRDQQFVALVKGGGDAQTRERIFAGFNTPLLPEVLICTSVGQEGIDLHRHCRNVVHYDLAWNPAVLEQRTGRVDRIGCKTFRERSTNGQDPLFLEIGVPFLAGTYDERMYEELRLRSQMFEVLTGGDVSADNMEGRDDVRHAEGREEGRHFTALPLDMVSDLRVQLHVWKP